MKSKTGQQEIVGFVLIIVIVAVILMIFLWFLFRGSGNSIQTSLDMSNLVSANMIYTTNCSTTFIPQYKTGQELVKNCFNNVGEHCIDGRSVCDALNDTLKENIGVNLDISEDSPNKAYKVTISYHVPGSDEPDKTFFDMSKGDFTNCSARYGGSNSIFSGTGSIEVRLQVCKGRRYSLTGTG